MLQNKVAVITGGAAGIGEAAARLFVKEGARVVLGDLMLDKAQQLADELGEDKAVAVRCDVTKEAEVEALVNTALDKFGRLDIMCNNAGFAGRMNCKESLMENLDVDEFDRVLQINMRGVMLGTKHAARAMKACNTDRGCIINTASFAGLRVNLANGGKPALVPAGYASSKHGVITLTKVGACELAPYNIRCNAVAPGYTVTKMMAGIAGMPDAKMEDLERALAGRSVMKGVALLPSDIANAMMFLASDMARCINGHTLVVDQGVTAGVAGTVPALFS